MENLKLDLENQPAAKADAKPKVPKIHVVVDQEWVSLIANLLKQHQPELTNILCLGAYTDPEALHKAYTSSLILNPLFCINGFAGPGHIREQFVNHFVVVNAFG